MLHYKFAAVIVCKYQSTRVNILSVTSHSEHGCLNIIRVQITSSHFSTSSRVYFSFCDFKLSLHACEYYLKVQILTYKFRFLFWKFWRRILQVLTSSLRALAFCTIFTFIVSGQRECAVKEEWKPYFLMVS